jgi:hypothetical protein
MSCILRLFSAALACAIAVSVTYTKAASAEEKPAPQATLDALRQDFGMADVVSLLAASTTRTSSKAYLGTRATRFAFIETKSQGPLVVDAYTVLDMKSNIIGYSLYYGGDNGPLVFANAVVNNSEKDAVNAAAKLVAAALDSVSLPDGSKVYFLGIQNLDASRDFKIMVRVGAQAPTGSDYSIRYVVSRR